MFPFSLFPLVLFPFLHLSLTQYLYQSLYLILSVSSYVSLSRSLLSIYKYIYLSDFFSVSLSFPFNHPLPSYTFVLCLKMPSLFCNKVKHIAFLQGCIAIAMSYFFWLQVRARVGTTIEEQFQLQKSCKYIILDFFTLVRRAEMVPRFLVLAPQPCFFCKIKLVNIV